ncbi:MAG: hypothetical protein K9M54_05610 [Kiritimatiellales bacterium]|nr:hypothetical protein [Kiritimatiellales bacterium]
MNLGLVIAAVVSAAGCCASTAHGATALAEKDAFTGGFPKYVWFRGGERNVDPVDVWEKRLDGTVGIIRKFMPEELRELGPAQMEWVEPYARKHPEKLLLLHLNGEGRQVMDFPEVQQRYFPGHWVYEPGTTLLDDVDSKQSRLHVRDTSVFNPKGYLDHIKNKYHPQHIALIPLDEQGHHVWDATEFTILKSVNTEDGTIEVERGAIYSKAHAFKRGKTYVAPLAAGVWGNRPMWYYNLSADCPRNGAGRSAAEVYTDEIASWFGPTGPLHALDGIAFDVNYFTARKSFDTNNDGQSDGGIINGTNRWSEGDWMFLKGLRQALGEGRLMTADGQMPINQRAAGVLDGVESEGLVQPHDGFRGISRTINTHLYWKENNPRPLDFRYIVLKLMTPADEERGEQLRRFATALACCLEAAVTVGPTGDPALPEPFTAPGSLGHPKGPMLRLAQDTPDLLHGASVKIIKPVDGCVAKKTPEGLVLSPSPGQTGDGFGFEVKALEVPAGDLTVFVEMQALDPLEGFSRDDYVPRLVHGDLSPLPDYGESRRLNGFYHDLYGYAGTHRPSLLSFYFRRPGRPAEPVDLTFRVEGMGRVVVRSITAHASPDLILRRFDNGTVVVNPSLEPATIPIEGMAVPVTAPALDALLLPVR